MSLEDDIQEFLKRNLKPNPIRYVVRQTIIHGEVLLGEFHHEPERKARFLAEVMKGYATEKASHTWYYAGEAFLSSDRPIVRDYLATTGSKPDAKGLSDDARPYVPILDAVRAMPDPKPASVLAAGHKAMSNRDKLIFDAFLESVAEQKLARTIRGSFLMGAFHAARQAPDGSTTKTTCQLLLENNPELWSVRLTTPSPTSQKQVDVKPATISITGGETETVVPLSGSVDEIDLMPILDRVANGTNFYVDIGCPSSPFGRIKLSENTTGRVPYNKLYDAIIHLVN